MKRWTPFVVLALLCVSCAAVKAAVGVTDDPAGSADPETIAGGVGAAVSVFNPAIGALIAAVGAPVAAFFLKKKKATP